ncbi:MAG: DNA polymerase III subunit alpha [Chloroflexi bacterium]|nr:DNA polymerase III subunit alpha [Chloroflexota bacterium]
MRGPVGSPFTHLHLHTEYSMLDGLCQVDALIERGKALGMDAMGLTDHGVLHAAIDFYHAAKSANIKPIIGIEAYLARGSRHDKTNADKQPNHITLLAKNNTGYQNLIKLATKAQLEGYYYKPRIDRELLQQHGEGIIAFSGCLNGPLPTLLQQGRYDDAKESALWFKDVLGDFYLEMQRHDNIPELVEVNKRLLDIHRETGIPLVATNDVHYVHKDDHETQDILLCIQTNTTQEQANRMKMSDPSYYVRSTEEMETLFSDMPQAIASTRAIAEMCDVTMDFNKSHLPRYPVPGGKAADDYLVELCWTGLKWRFGEASERHKQQLAYELDVIRKTRFSDYFLVIWDISKYVRDQKILMGVRGSAASSLVLYCLGVTNVDPMAYRLVFERFLNIERKEMPDIDMDFQDDRREEVIDYVVKRYGADRVAQIITYGTLGAKAALRDTGRALGMSYADVDGVARLIPAGYYKGEKGEIKQWTIEHAKAALPEFNERYASDAVIKKLVDTAQKLEGVVRNAGTHAAGVVISDEPLIDYVPLQRAAKGDGEGIAVTQFSMEAIAKLGLLKMDFLGLINLNILQKTLKFIKENRGEEIDLLKVPLDNPKTFELLSSGETTGLFQLESTGMRRYIKELRPTSLGDLSAMIALYRPGPMEQIPRFIRCKRGEERVAYPHDILKSILEETYGIIVYQDQVLLVLREFAGYSLGQADIVRKAMGKKIASLMQQEKGRFIEGAAAKGYSKELSNQVWDLIEPFAGYAFNKAHSVSYALIAYWTAYFKANYDVEFMTALLTCFQGTQEKVQTTIAECRVLKIEVRPPDINAGTAGFTIERGASGSPAIRFSLAAVKNVGEAAVSPLVAEREKGGPFKNVQDFCRRAPVKSLNKKTLETLIKVGAFDSLGPRGGLLANIDRIVGIAQQQAHLRETGQSTMFDLFGTSVPVPMPDIELEEDEIPQKQRLEWQRELLGVYLDDHPLARVAIDLGRDAKLCGEITPELEGEKVMIAGQVTQVRRMATRKDNRQFAAITLKDLMGSVEVTVWPNVFERTMDLWQEDKLLVIHGKVKLREDKAQVICDSVETYEAAVAKRAANPPAPTPAEPAAAAPLRANGHATNGNGRAKATQSPHVRPEPVEGRALAETEPPRLLHLTLRETDDPDGDLRRLTEVQVVLRDRPGRNRVRLTVVSEGAPTDMDLPVTTACDDALLERLRSLLGPEGVKVA